MKIRKAKYSDLKEITNQFIDCYSCKPFNENWNYETARKKIKKYFKTDYIFVYINKSELLGTIIFSEEIWPTKNNFFIKEIFVKKEFQNKGIGKTLIRFVEKIGKKKNIKAINLLSNEKSIAHKIYKKNSYKKVMALLEKELN